MTEEKQKQLGKTLWAIADQLRGAMDACYVRRSPRLTDALATRCS